MRSWLGGPEKAAVRFLRGLASNEQLDGDAQATLDRELCELDGKKWTGSAERRALLCRWLEPKSPGDVFVAGCRRLKQTWADGELATEQYIAAVRPAVVGSEKLNESERYAFGGLIFGRYEKSKRKVWFDFQTEVVRATKVAELRREAVLGLKKFAPATEQELQVVEKLRDNESDQEVRKRLDYVLGELRTAKGPK